MRTILCAAALLMVGSTITTGARAQMAAPVTTNTITVQGTGMVTVKPDVAFLNLSVETRNVQADAATQENARIADAVVKALKAAGVADKDIQTANYSIYQGEEPDPQGRPIPGSGVGPTRRVYIVTNAWKVTVRKIGDAGKVLDAALKAGANGATGIRFGVADPKPFQRQALMEAVTSARQEAEVIAAAAGVSNLKVESIEELGGGGRPLPAGDTMFLRSVAQTPVQTGELTITVTITARFKFN